MTPASRPRPERESLPVQTRRLLRHAGLRARKGLGQHFLIDESVLRLIIKTAELASTDVVVEIGPGLGVLTRELAERSGRVIAVELDDRLAAVLKESLAAFDNVTIINGDILKIDPAVLLRETGGPEYKVVANLPYYITSPVLRHFLEASTRPRTMVVMVQKEVAEVIAAKPGRMSLLSVGVQLYGEPEIVGHVAAECFYPVPEVDSAILKISVSAEPGVAVRDEAGFFSVVRAGFSASRKQLVNSLVRGLGLPRAEVLRMLEESGIEPRRRAETLSLEEWSQLWKVYSGTYY
ncbi:MAG: 16S rRNA (adenine(1518)-N(6)/adenine(1519)-N(6))-dimethyltransferase RsmA [Dehalococcoidales bacterium]|nr:16S rRNA (adenine(1518)-N(6)/adenine(1519)-N(6))-dimethyltransferase RsmA [Dehalococcoidales bacterium]